MLHIAAMNLAMHRFFSAHREIMTLYCLRWEFTKLSQCLAELFASIQIAIVDTPVNKFRSPSVYYAPSIIPAQ